MACFKTMWRIQSNAKEIGSKNTLKKKHKLKEP